jgi:pyruvate dehydrogenase E2 component (dihydrolipoyllysine-residue acetyltransferase)
MTLTKLGVPKWGLSMKEGRVVAWLVDEGAEVAQGEGVAEIETEKINGVVESPVAGTLLRRVGQEGEVLPVGGLLGVIGDPATDAGGVDAFVADFEATFVPEEEGESGPQPETTEVGGRRVRYLRLGEGDEVVVLVHGFGGDMTNWLFNQDHLAEDRTVYVVDLPGHGGSAKAVDEGSVAELAGVVGGLLDALDVGAAHVVGHSLGGAVATQLATDAPGRVRSLVLIAPVGFGEDVNAAYVEGFVAAQSRRELKPVLELLFADTGLVTRQMTEDVLRAKRLDGATESLQAIAAATFPEGRQQVALAGPLAAAEVPVLVVWGSEDRIVPVGHASAMPARARVTIIEGQGHSPHMEAAGEVNRAIADFLASLR